MYGHLKWGVANRRIFPSDEALFVIFTTNNNGVENSLWGVYLYQCIGGNSRGRVCYSFVIGDGLYHMESF